MAFIDLHIKPSAHTPSKSFVNEISSPSTYTNTDGYTVSYYTGLFEKIVGVLTTCHTQYM